MKITVLPGDGIGVEVTNQAVKVLHALADIHGWDLEIREALLGGTAYDATGTPIPADTVTVCTESDAVLLGAVGGPKWDHLTGDLRPEAGLLGIRKALGVFANLRPAILFPQLKSASFLKEEVLGDGLNVMIVRELTGGLYFGEKQRIAIEGGFKAWDTMVYTTQEIDRIARVAFDLAMQRNKKLCSVDKANVLGVSRLWREVVIEVAKEYPEVALSHMYVDNAAMQLIRDPGQFDVILTENTFGDILSDEASMLTGSLGMLPSASVGGVNGGLYEPCHGSAPDIAGQDKANPIGSILCAAMMLRTAFREEAAAQAIEGAVYTVLEAGYRTGDILQPGKILVGTEEMGDRIAEAVRTA